MDGGLVSWNNHKTKYTFSRILIGESSRLLQSPQTTHYFQQFRQLRKSRRQHLKSSLAVQCHRDAADEFDWSWTFAFQSRPHPGIKLLLIFHPRQDQYVLKTAGYPNLLITRQGGTDNQMLGEPDRNKNH